MLLQLPQRNALIALLCLAALAGLVGSGFAQPEPSPTPKGMRYNGVAGPKPISIGGDLRVTVVPPIGWLIFSAPDRRRYAFKRPYQETDAEGAEFAIKLKAIESSIDRTPKIVVLDQIKEIKQALALNPRVADVDVQNGFHQVRISSGQTFQLITSRYQKDGITMKQVDAVGFSNRIKVVLSFAAPLSRAFDYSWPKVETTLMSLRLPGGNIVSRFGGLETVLVLPVLIGLMVLFIIYLLYWWWSRSRPSRRQYFSQVAGDTPRQGATAGYGSGYEEDPFTIDQWTGEGGEILIPAMPGDIAPRRDKRQGAAADKDDILSRDLTDIGGLASADDLHSRHQNDARYLRDARAEQQMAAAVPKLTAKEPPKVGSEVEAEPTVETNSEPRPEPRPEPKAEVKEEAEPKVEAKAEASAESSAKAEPAKQPEGKAGAVTIAAAGATVAAAATKPGFWARLFGTKAKPAAAEAKKVEAKTEAKTEAKSPEPKKPEPEKVEGDKDKSAKAKSAAAKSAAAKKVEAKKVEDKSPDQDQNDNKEPKPQTTINVVKVKDGEGKAPADKAKPEQPAESKPGFFARLFGRGKAAGSKDAAKDAGAQDAGAQDAGAQDAGAQDAGAQKAALKNEPSSVDIHKPLDPKVLKEHQAAAKADGKKTKAKAKASKAGAGRPSPSINPTVLLSDFGDAKKGDTKADAKKGDSKKGSPKADDKSADSAATKVNIKATAGNGEQEPKLNVEIPAKEPALSAAKEVPISPGVTVLTEEMAKAAKVVSEPPKKEPPTVESEFLIHPDEGKDPPEPEQTTAKTTSPAKKKEATPVDNQPQTEEHHNAAELNDEVKRPADKAKAVAKKAPVDKKAEDKKAEAKEAAGTPKAEDKKAEDKEDKAKGDKAAGAPKAETRKGATAAQETDEAAAYLTLSPSERTELTLLLDQIKSSFNRVDAILATAETRSQQQEQQIAAASKSSPNS